MCCAYGCCIRTEMLSSYQVVLQVEPKSTYNRNAYCLQRVESQKGQPRGSNGRDTSAWYEHAGQVTSGVPEACVCIIWSRLYHALSKI